MALLMFKHCQSCGHVEEDHAMNAPEGEQECLVEDCNCSNFKPQEGEGVNGN